MSDENSSKYWDTAELERAGAINTGPVQAPDLANELHPLLVREKWTNVKDHDFNLLLPSLRLASNLIAAGTDYLAQFLPSEDLHDQLSAKKENRTEICIDFRRKSLGDDDLKKTRKELEEIAEDIEWRLNKTLADNGALGMTRHVKEGFYAQEPWPTLEKDTISTYDDDARQQGCQRRPLLVGIMHQYLDAIKSYPPDSESRLRAVFHAAVTITHEVGHVVWCQDFRDQDYGQMGEEPFVKDYAQAELGFCFEAFLFSGFRVRTAKVSAGVPLHFESAAIWDPYLTTDVTGRTDRPLYRTQFAIPISYMKQVLTQNFWDHLESQTDGAFSARAVAALRPSTNSSASVPVATARARNWTVPFQGRKPEWERRYKDRGKFPDAAIKTIPNTEIEKVKEELRPHFKPYRKGENPFGEDDDEDFEDLGEYGFNLSAYQYLDDGAVKMDYISEDTNVNPSSKVTRAEVKYSPPDTVNTASSKVTDEDDDRPAKRQKLLNGGQSIDDYLKSTSVERLTGRVTHEIARDFCIGKHIEPGPFPTDEALQRSKLSADDKVDRALIERIRSYHFRNAEELWVNDPLALVKIKQQRLASFEHWDSKDVKDLCIIQGLPKFGEDQRLRDRARRWLRMDLADAKSILKKDFLSEPLPPDVTSDYDTWSFAEFATFFRTHNLPQWGDNATLRLRVQRFRDEQYIGGLLDRTILEIGLDDNGNPIDRVDDHGIEHYAFDVAVERTTVQALKGYLFELTKIPADQDIKIYFGADRQNTLGPDDAPLSSLSVSGAKIDWTSLEMTTEALKVPTPEPESPLIPVFVPRAGLPRSGTDDGGSGNGGSASSSAGRNRSSTGHCDNCVCPPKNTDPPAPPTAPKVEPPLKREYDLQHGNIEPTFRERMKSISQQGSALDKVIIAGGGIDPLRPHLKNVIANSTSEMLDTFQDIEELQEEKENRIDQLAENPGMPNLKPLVDTDGIPKDSPDNMARVVRRLSHVGPQGDGFSGVL
ncbi:uncharacterized protein PAC_12345 [Phialocephala subalpina]|uniref:Uncharacterized protein n=1 Tax=Phialocephala subalpina TaxID=576137 RepID=A0A1L7XBP5_9HELO|nr:uncharacterized protein PAC_12345 [Phialocephala subalpina]